MSSDPKASWSRRDWLLASAVPFAVAAASSPSAEPCFWTLSETVLQIRKRKISSEELTKLCLGRIRQRDKRLNAFITITADSALDQARALDRDLSRGVVRGPLHGVPLALKDNIDTAGILTTAASRIFEKRVPKEDAEVTRRVAAAGAVMLGKLNLDEFAFAGSGTTGSFGPSHNPWNLDHITGGSSAGPGAAVADGLCYGSIGTDDGGSVRIPGAHCGIVGLKTSFGRVSTRGIVPSAYSLDTVGPMTRTVEDAALMLQVMAGYDPLDAIVLDEPVPDYSRSLKTPIAKLRIGVPRPYFFDDLDPDVSTAVENAISHMRGKTALVKDVTLPQFQFVHNGSTDIELYHYQRPYFEEAPEQYHPSSRRLLERARETSAERYVETLKRIREARRDIRKTFEEVDILLLPTMREPAPLIQEYVEHKRRPRPSNVSAFNRFGLPAITVPCGFTKNNLPIGLQIVAPSFREDLVIAAAYAYQQSTDWHQQHPPA